ncbi:MAG: hypothetical protein K6L74_08720 [Neptuniibacter sp.]
MDLNTSNCHKQENQSSSKTTLRLHRDSLILAATDLGIQDPIEIIAETLDLEEGVTSSIRNRNSPVGIQALSDLSFLLHEKTTQSILHQWMDEEWVTDLLSIKTTEIDNLLDPDIRFGISTSPKKFPKSHSLVALLVQDFPENDSPPLKHFKSQLRLWIIIQSLIRAEEHKCFADQNIQTVAFYIANRTHGKKDGWGLIDELHLHATPLLQKTDNSFSAFTNAIAIASGYIEDLNDSEARFIKALIAISYGIIKPTRDQPPQSKWISDTNKLVSSGVKEFVSHSQEEKPEDNIQLDEEFDQVLQSADPNQTYCEQILSSLSVLRQTAEQSQFLPYGTEKPAPFEVTSLIEWIETNLHADQEIDRLGSALIVVGLLTSNTTEQLTATPFYDPGNKGWWLDHELQTLRKAAPRRRSSWSPTSEEMVWVEPSSSELRVTLDPVIANNLKEVFAKTPSPSQLGALWFTVSPEATLEQWFLKQMSDTGSRLRSGMLPRIIQQEFFNQTGLFALTRLLTAQHNSALPSSCSYVTSQEQDLENIWQSTFLSKYATIEAETPTAYAIGSRLVLIENKIANEVSAAIEKIESLRSGNPILFHNAYTAYCIMELFAGTGSRPTKSPFQSINDFNFNELLVCIDDKSDSEVHGTRLVPLPEKVVELITQGYLPHLKVLSGFLKETRPELARSIETLSCPETVSTIPLFFFLSESGDLQHVTPSSEHFRDLFQWTLPSNLFRHFYIQKLQKSGVDSEIIEGWCGHIEHGIASYGDLSERCWTDDVSLHRPKIQNLLFDLKFRFIKGLDPSSPNNITFKSSTQDSEALNQQIFGRELRRLERAEKIESAKNETQQCIDKFVAKTGIETLTDEQIDDLVDLVTSSGRRNNTLKPLAAYRFEYLFEWLNETQLNETRPQIRVNKHVRRFNAPHNPFNTETPRSLEIDQKLKQSCAQILDSTYPSQIGHLSALQIAAIALCIENRIAYFQLLHDVSEGRNFRVLRFRGQCYIEYSEALVTNDIYCPVQRHAIKSKLAALLDRGLEIHKSRKSNSKGLPKPLQSLSALLSETPTPSFSELLSMVAKYIDQSNSVNLPGYIAGALSGRVPTTSLHLCDWLRIEHGVSFDLSSLNHFSLPIPETSVKPESGAALEALLDKAEKDNEQNTTQSHKGAQDIAKTYTRKVYELLSTYTKSESKKIASQVRQLHLTMPVSPSNTLIALSEWIAHRIDTGLSNKDEPLSQSSIQTYYSTLSNAFAEFGYQVDLHTLDSDDFTSFYYDLLSSRKTNHPKSLSYFKDRLVEFHNFAVSAYLLPPPNWDELGIEVSGRSVSPGYVTEAEYLKTLDYIQNDDGLNHQIEKDFACFITLLCFRYGLRRKEAMLIRRKDIQVIDGDFYVYVQGYRGHSLKSKSSRRLVPPLNLLSNHEKIIIEAVFNHYQMRVGAEHSKALIRIFDVATLEKTFTLVPTTIINTLRAVTTNASMVLHHLRHSFLNRVLATSLDLRSIIAPHDPSGNSQLMRKIILGPQNGVSRRFPIALARLMGHFSSVTTFRSYCHLLTDIIDHKVGGFEKTYQKLKNTIQLDDCKLITQKDRKVAPIPVHHYEKLTVPSLVNLMEYVGKGVSPKHAIRDLNLPPSIESPFIDVIKAAARTIWFKLYENGQVKGEKAPSLLLTRISRPAWERMTTYASLMRPISPFQGPDLLRLPQLVGQTRQIIMQKECDFSLVKQVLDEFKIPSDRYQVLQRGDDQSQRILADKFGFEISARNSDSSKSLLIDNFRDPKVLYDRNYLVLELERGKDGPLRNRADFIVAFLAIGLLNALKQPPDNQAVG